MVFNEIDLLHHLMKGKDNKPIYKLYNILLSNEELNDRQVMFIIYGKNNPTAFAGLKSRMRNILFNLLIYSNLNQENSKNRLYQVNECMKYSFIFILMKDKNNFELLIKYLEKAILKSIKCEAIESIIIQSRILIWYYSVRNESRNKYKKYVALLNEYILILNLEIKSIIYISEFQKYQISSAAKISNYILLKSLKYYKELENSSIKQTMTITYSKYLLQAFYYEHSKKYEQLLKISLDMVAEFNKRTLFIDNRLNVTMLRQLYAYIQLGRFNEAVLTGNKIHKRIKDGSFEWFITGYYILKAIIYKGDYRKAVGLLGELLTHTKYNSLPAYMKEIYSNVLGYTLVILQSKGFIELNILQSNLPEFRMAKFLNTVPVYSKDKRGINISILLLHAAYLIQKKKFSDAIDRIESLNRYAGRYLRKDDTFRSNCMIKMLVQMAKADFHPIKTERYTANLRKQLDLVPVTGSGGNIEVEIIPFEVLWDILMKAIQPVATPRRRSRA